MKTFPNLHLWKTLPLLAASIALASCETVDKGVDKWDGMSNKDQKTLIGGLGGAVVGAVVSGGKAGGAIIGGAAGAVGGRVLGERQNESNLTTP